MFPLSTKGSAANWTFTQNVQLAAEPLNTT